MHINKVRYIAIDINGFSKAKSANYLIIVVVIPIRQLPPKPKYWLLLLPPIDNKIPKIILDTDPPR